MALIGPDSLHNPALGRSAVENHHSDRIDLYRTNKSGTMLVRFVGQVSTIKDAEDWVAGRKELDQEL
jgi:hypothetical protein